jgi:putative pyruvate formate lyase activating enzyme
MPDSPVLSRAALHFWEEPCISGEEGSGTVFFSGCNLRCVYCQNAEIAAGVRGKEISVERVG